MRRQFVHLFVHAVDTENNVTRSLTMVNSSIALLKQFDRSQAPLIAARFPMDRSPLLYYHYFRHQSAGIVVVFDDVTELSRQLGRSGNLGARAQPQL